MHEEAIAVITIREVQRFHVPWVPVGGVAQVFKKRITIVATQGVGG